MDQGVESVGYRLSGEQFERFRQLVHARSGIALRPEKAQLLCSRLARRLRELGLGDFDAYYARVTQDGSGVELEQLINAVTTNKTSFFREEHHFDALRDRVLAPMVKAGRRKLRVWSAGCSTGEEPYSILITALEAIPDWARADVRVLASDIDSQVLAFGARAVYPRERFEGVPDALRRRYFIEGTGEKAGLMRVRGVLRERVAFRQINFVAPDWPVHATFDAVFCRNALIYFDIETQRKVVTRLLAYLVPGGLLCLGHSESMAGVHPGLRSLGRTTYAWEGAP
ncbi:MAG: protein-glutamate O-methyltransferase CheR [Polyangiales bacterium]